MKERLFLFASTNPGKLAEVRAISALYGIDVVGMAQVEKSRGKAPAVEESSDTCQGNAWLKANAYAAWSHLPTLADDTGLEVFSLEGRPGVNSARYAGAGATAGQNRDKLLRELDTQSDRTARFVCVLAYVDSNQKRFQANASLAGVITETPAGEGGFGYDCIFFLPEYGVTLAEAKASGIEVETHRTRALKILFDQIVESSSLIS